MRFRSVVVGLVALIVASPTGFASAEGEGGPCNGKTTSSQRIEAHLVGKASRTSPKVIVHVESNADGVITGELVFERGRDRVLVGRWCRLWSGGEGGAAGHEGVVHVLGTETRRDGTQHLIRVDVTNSEGGEVRVRTRSLSHGGHSESVETEHGWTSLTGEGWLPLSRLRIRSVLG